MLIVVPISFAWIGLQWWWRTARYLQLDSWRGQREFDRKLADFALFAMAALIDRELPTNNHQPEQLELF